MSSTVAPPHPALTAEALAAIYEHALRDHPNECCGIVYGPKGEPVAARAVACANTQNDLHAEDPATHTRDARTAYALGGTDLFKVGKSQRTAEPVKIIYHSHVDVGRADGAYFSETDQAAATMDGEPSYDGVEYVVVDIRRDGVRGAAQFAWDAGTRSFVEIGRYPGP